MSGPAVCDPKTTSPAASGSQPSLKKQWDLSDPPPLGSSTNDAANKFLTDFKAAMEPVKQCLLYTKINAEKPKHDAMINKRDPLYAEFPSKLAEINKDESKADAISKPFLDRARGLAAEANKLKQNTENSAKAWQALETAYTKSEQQIEELEKWGHKEFADLRKAGDAIRAATNENQYDEAVKLLGHHLTKLKPIYEEYVKQKEAKQFYDDQYKKLEPKLPKSSQPTGMPPAMQKEIAEGRQQMESSAKDKDYLKALKLLDNLALKAGDPEVLCFEGKVLRADNALLYKLVVDLAESKGIKAPSEFSGRLKNADMTWLKGTERPGLLQDVLKGLDEANRRLDKEREEFCTKFESTANEAARGLLDESKKTIEAELARLGITGDMVHLETGGSYPSFTCSNPDAAKGARKAAAQLLELAKVVDSTGKESAEAFKKLAVSQQKDPFNVMNRPLVEDHEAKRKKWMDASEKYETGRRTHVAANPSIALFAEEPGVVAKLTGLASMKDSDFANDVGEKAKRRLENIEQVRNEIGKRFGVWRQTHLVRVTLDQMNATPFQREAVEWKAGQKQRQDADDKLLFAAIAIGLGLVSAIPTGGAGLMAGISIAAGLAGASLALYQVGAQINEYSLAMAANATDLEKAKAISHEDPDGRELALNCVLALGDVFAAAAAFKALGGIVKAVKGGDVAAALKLASAAENVGIKGSAKAKIVGEAVAGLNGEAIEKVGKTIAKSGDSSAAGIKRMVAATAEGEFKRQLADSLKLMENIQGRIPDTARKMVAENKVMLFSEETLQKVYGKVEGSELWQQYSYAGGFYSGDKDIIFLAAGSTEDLAGTLIHEATHRVGAANPLRGNDFMSEAIAEFAERDFYMLLYGPDGPLQGTKVRSERITKFLEWSDEKLMENIQIRYVAAKKELPQAQRLQFMNLKNASVDDVVKQIFTDIAADYKKNLPKAR